MQFLYLVRVPSELDLTYFGRFSLMSLQPLLLCVFYSSDQQAACPWQKPGQCLPRCLSVRALQAGGVFLFPPYTGERLLPQ